VGRKILEERICHDFPGCPLVGEKNPLTVFWTSTHEQYRVLAIYDRKLRSHNEFIGRWDG
jgi:hypothetical protein